jgi:hypothetical protein
LTLVKGLPNGTLNPVAETVDVDVTENVCGTGAELMGIDAGTGSWEEDDTGADDAVNKVEVESSGVPDKGAVTAGKVNLSPGILLLELKPNNDFEEKLDAGAPDDMVEN